MADECRSRQRCLFVEEPLPSSASHGYRALRAGSSIAIAWGEHAQSIAEFVPLISEKVVSVIQPDLAMVGGLTPVLDLAVIAEAFDVTVSPHFLPGLFVHIAAASSAVRWLEEFPLLEPLFEGWPSLENGTLTGTGSPGHGLQLSELARSETVSRI